MTLLSKLVFLEMVCSICHIVIIYYSYKSQNHCTLHTRRARRISGRSFMLISAAAGKNALGHARSNLPRDCLSISLGKKQIILF